MQVQIFVPSRVRFGEQEKFTLMRMRGVSEQDAMRALEQTRGDRSVERADMRNRVSTVLQ